MNRPKNHTHIKIESVKHDGALHRRWEENHVLFSDHERLIGMNNRTIVTNNAGIQSQTILPALFYFEYDKWFNIVYIFDGLHGFYYCNISSPCEFLSNTIRYIDYDIDITVQQDFSYHIVDLDEYETHLHQYEYSKSIQQQIHQGVAQLKQMIENRSIPFQSSFIQQWKSCAENKGIC